MPKNIFLTATFVAVGLCTALAQVPTQKELEQKRSDWERIQIMDTQIGDVPFDRLLPAYEQANKKATTQSMRLSSPLISTNSITNCDNPNWIEVGPTSFANQSCAGRVRSVCLLPNGNSAFIGGVTGGIWKTNNINAANPNLVYWEKVNDYFQNLNVTTIAYQANTAAPNNITTLYFGTGEGLVNDATGWYNPAQISHYNKGAGIWKSTNGGITWNILPATENNGSFKFTQKIIVTAPTVLYPNGIVYAGTNAGIQKSTDTGVTWTNIGLPNSNGNSEVSDIEVAADGVTIFASLGIERHNGLWRYTTANGWEKIGGANTPAGRGIGLPLSNNTQFLRCEIATAPNDLTANILYVAIVHLYKRKSHLDTHY